MWLLQAIILLTFTYVNAMIRVESLKGINARSLESTVIGLIEDFSRKIAEYGFDPYFVERTEYETTVIPNFLRVHLSLTDLLFTGASNIVVNDLKYSVRRHALFIELSLPQIFFSTEEILSAVVVYGRYYKTISRGSIAFNEVRFWAEIAFLGSNEHIFVEDVQAKLNLGHITPNINMNVFGVAIGPAINEFMRLEVPKIIRNNSVVINAVLGSFIKKALNQTMELI